MFKQRVNTKSVLVALKVVLLCLSLQSMHTLAKNPPSTYQEAHQLYYTTLNNDSFTNLEKKSSWILLYQFLENKTYFNLTSLTLFQLATLAADDQDIEEYSKWTSFLKRLNQIKQDPVVELLLAKSELDNNYHKNEYVKSIELGLLFLEKVKQINRSNEEVLPGIEMSLPEFEVVDAGNTVGLAYFMTGNYDKAYEYFLQTLEGFESLSYKKGIANSYNNLSMIGWARRDFEKALVYLRKGLIISESIGDTKSILTNLTNQGIYYSNLGQSELAIESFKKALEHEQSDQFPKSKIHTMLAFAQIYIGMNDYDNSKKLVQESLDLAKLLNDSLSISYSLMTLASINSMSGQYREAITLYLSALEFYQNKAMKNEEATVLSRLSQTYELLDDSKSSLDYFKRYHELNAELIEEAQQKSVNELQEKYDAKAREKEIVLLKKDNEIKARSIENEQQEKRIIEVLGAALLIFLFLAISRYYSRKETLRLKEYTLQIEEREKQLLLLSNAFKGTTDAVWIANSDFEIEVVNDAFLQLTMKKNVIGQKVEFALVNEQDESFSENIRSKVIEHGQWQGELFDQTSEGHIFPLEMKISAIKDDDGIINHFLGVFRDISQQRQAQEHLMKLATHDDLTNIPNRVLFVELVQRSLVGVDRAGYTPMVLFVDVDGFKKINDSLGHDIGDQLICHVARRLNETMRGKDVVARIGGDEFCILAELNGEKINAVAVAKKVLSAFEEPFIVELHSLKITVSIGVSIYPDDAESAEDLLRKADIAMNKAKESGKNTFSFFEQHMNDEVDSLLVHEQKIIKAIDNRYFEFFYQPIINIAQNRILSAEALIRCREPNGTLIFPDQFIPYAERSGLIERIDEIVIDEVFKQLSTWNLAGINLPQVSLNLSGRIFSQANKLIKLLESKIRTYSVRPESIKIEITEGMLLSNIERSIETMYRLKSIGFVLAIDDFGTGFSSLNYLKQFPIDILKIDRTFIMDMHESDKNKSIVRSIVELAHNLELTVVAEGVELDEHLNTLRELECEEYQGYLFSKPIEVKAFETLVLSHQDK